MYIQDEKTNSYAASAHATGWSGTLRRVHEQAAPEQPPQSTPAPPPDTSPANASSQAAQEQSDWNTLGRQDARITSILRQMSIGHLTLGIVLTIAGAILEGTLHQSAFFGLAASGAMLGACGLITLLAINRQQANPSALGFYLLPYADFAIVGLWLLLFGTTSPILLFYAYIIVSAALLLGSRHAITLAIISAATTLTVSLGEYAQRVEPAIILRDGEQFVFISLFTALAIGLMVYVAALFSSNLDRFISENNRQRNQLSLAHARLTEQQQQVARELELLNDAYLRFIGGETHARVSVSSGALALAGQHINALFEQIEQLARFASQHMRMEARAVELNAAMERLGNGDMNALQALSAPSGTSLDDMTVALVRIMRQMVELQQALQRARVDFGVITNLASELTMARQGLNSAGNAIRELLSRSAQSAVHMRSMIDTEMTPAEGRYSERPFMREMELRARQQSAGLELLYARLEHVMAQMDATEYELRRLVENADASARRLPRATFPINPTLEQMGLLPPGAQISPKSGPITYAPMSSPSGSGPVNSAPLFPRAPSGPLNSAPLQSRTPSGQLTPADQPAQPGSGAFRMPEAHPLPRRFTSPMMPPPRQEQNRPAPWQVSPETPEEGANVAQ
jgi:hypothetical protein